jgi:hypothetical protein
MLPSGRQLLPWLLLLLLLLPESGSAGSQQVVWLQASSLKARCAAPVGRRV